MTNEPRILILEDQPTDAELAIRELRQAQIAFKARRVETKEEFLKAVKEFDPDIILSDYSFPHFNALDALQLIKDLGVDLPFILYTGTLTEEVAVECMKEGIADYILKSSLKRLPSAILNALEKKQSRKTKEEAINALRVSEMRYRLLVEQSPEMVAVCFERRFVYINAAGVELLGAARADEIIGKSILDFVHPDCFDVVLSHVLQCENGERTPLMELKVVRLDGKAIDVETTCVPTIHQNKPAIQVIIRNISEQKKAERALIEAENRLQQAQKMEAIGTLTSGVAHDFNNLLTAILGNAQLAKRKLSSVEMTRPHLEEIEKASARAAQLTSKLLAFSRRQHLKPRIINLNDTINETVKLLERIIGEDIKMSVNCSVDLSPVFADPVQIEQVVMNLSVNARDAMPQGGRLTIATSNAELGEDYCRRYPYVKPGKYVQICVEDTGTGMDAEMQKRIFEPFFTTKEVGKGTGLGLSMAYGIVKQHDGHINVYSEIGQGTTFRIFLPATAQAVEDPAPAILPSLLGGTETILIAEDEEALRKLAKSTLESLGYTVLAAKDGIEAVEIFAANRDTIDMLLFDVVMPRMSGAEAGERIKAMGSDLPLILMTGYSAETVQNRFVKRTISAEELGAVVLQKPYGVDDLGRRVREVLDAAQ